MTANELPGTVMSDDHIANALKQDGISIARRTVAKYRDAMHIPSSIQRRRLKGYQRMTSQKSHYAIVVGFVDSVYVAY